MTRPTRVALVGLGAFGRKHQTALAAIAEATVVATADTAPAYAELLARDDVDAVILATPTPQHADQAVAALHSGKHVSVEIPVADSRPGLAAVAAAAESSGLVCAVGHTRRYNPSHRWIRHRIESGEFGLQHLQVHTHFLRRSNINALGEPRDWTDHLLWHHAAHTVDLLRYQTGEEIAQAHILAGPTHPDLGIALDMSIQLRTTSGVLCTLALSFNNDGPIGSEFRYIGTSGTYLARYDDLTRGNGEPIDVRAPGVVTDGVEAQDRDFLRAIRTGADPVSALAAVLPSYQILAELSDQLDTAHMPT